MHTNGHAVTKDGTRSGAGAEKDTDGRSVRSSTSARTAGGIDSANARRLFEEGKVAQQAGKHERAVHCWHLAAESLNRNALTGLATCYFSGKGIKKDELEAHKFLVMAYLLPARESINLKQLGRLVALGELAITCCMRLKTIVDAEEAYGPVLQDFHQLSSLVSIFINFIEFYGYFQLQEGLAETPNQLKRRKNFTFLINQLLKPREADLSVASSETYGERFKVHLARTKKSCANSLKSAFGSAITLLGGGKERYLSLMLKLETVIAKVEEDSVIHLAALAFVSVLSKQAEAKEATAVSLSNLEMDEGDSISIVSWANSVRTTKTAAYGKTPARKQSLAPISER